MKKFFSKCWIWIVIMSLCFSSLPVRAAEPETDLFEMDSDEDLSEVDSDEDFSEVDSDEDFDQEEALYESHTFFNATEGEAKVRRTALDFENGKSVCPMWGLEKLSGNANISKYADRDLAVVALALCRAANNTTAVSEDTEIYQMVETLGFMSPYLAYQTKDDVVDYPGMTFAIHPRKLDGKFVILGVFRGTTDDGDVNTDLGSPVNGFLTAGKNCEAELEHYIALQEQIYGIDINKDNTILFLTGHSYGGSCAGQVARLSRDKVALQEHIFVYTFGAPDYDIAGDVYEDEYFNIINIVNKNDIVPHVPSKGKKLGVKAVFDIDKDSSAFDASQNEKEFKTIYKYYREKDYDTDDQSYFSLGDIGIITFEHMPYTYMSFLLSEKTLFGDEDSYRRNKYLGVREVEGYDSDWYKDFDWDYLPNESGKFTRIILERYFGEEKEVKVYNHINIDENEYKVVLAEGVFEAGTVRGYYLDENCLEKVEFEAGVALGFEWDDAIREHVYAHSTHLRTQPGNSCGRMFYGCKKLKEVDLSGVDTSIAYDFSSMFQGCTSLEKVNLSSLNTSNATDMAWMFRGCKSLKALDLSSFKTSNVQNMYGMFEGCSSLKSLDLSTFNTGSAERMPDMFSGCNGLEKLDISSFHTENVVDMQGMFKNCASLKSLDVSSFQTGNCLRMSRFITNYLDRDDNGMFEGCASLTSLDLSSFDISQVGTLNGMFKNCTNLKTVKWGEVDAGGISSMEYMFYGCSHLESAEIEKFKTNGCKQQYMFADCKKLKQADISGFSYPSSEAHDYSLSYQYTGFMFSGCDALERVKSPLNIGDAIIELAEYNADGSLRRFHLTSTSPAGVWLNTKPKFAISQGSRILYDEYGDIIPNFSITTDDGCTLERDRDYELEYEGPTSWTVRGAGDYMGIAKPSAPKAHTEVKEARPAAPAGVKAENLATGIQISWKKTSGATGYYVYRNGSKIKTLAGGVNTYKDKKANSNGVKYTYYLAAFNKAGEGAKSKAVSVYRLAPVKITTISNSASKKAKVKWKTNTKGSGYQLRYSTSKAFAKGVKTVSLKGGKTSAKELSKLTKKKTWYVQIRVYKTVGGAKQFSVWSAARGVKINR